MSWDFSQFHFIRPTYLLIIPALMLLWFFLGRAINSSRWDSYISKDLLEVLKVEGGKGLRGWRWILLTGWLLASFAVAGPSWTKIPVPTVQNQKALVIMLDLSRSMLARDLSPNRLTLAKFKLIDILRRQADGQTALIAYAGDAHTVSPLSDDPKNIEALLPALHPNIMPTQGSNIEAAVALAEQLLTDAQLPGGDLLIITDGIESDAQIYLKKNVRSLNRISILGVASAGGAPIPVQGGGFLRGANDEIILASFNQADHRRLANNLNGNYAQIQTDESDIDHLLFDDFELVDSDNQAENQVLNATYDSWEDMGHWFVLLLLPLAAFCFRKGLIYVLPFILPAMLIFPTDSQAADFSWNDLWQTADQQAANLMSQEKYSDAAEIFNRDDWAAIANYKDGDFESASSHLESSDHINDIYNYGNALAFNGDLKASIEAYKKVLDRNPDQEDAVHNKEVVEKLLEQQKQQNDEQNQQDQNSSDGEQEQGEGEGDEQKSDQEGSENKDSESSEGDQQDQQQESDQESEGNGESQEENENKEEGDGESDKGEASEEKEEEQKLVEQLSAEQTPDELKPSSEQWLRAINNDPSGLLRRKFQYQAQQRLNKSQSSKQLEQQNERY